MVCHTAMKKSASKRTNISETFSIYIMSLIITHTYFILVISIVKTTKNSQNHLLLTALKMIMKMLCYVNPSIFQPFKLMYLGQFTKANKWTFDIRRNPKHLYRSFTQPIFLKQLKWCKIFINHWQIDWNT